MDETVAFILDSNDLVPEVCGANDYNLRIVEQLLGGRVLSRGNELFFEHPDAAVRTLFLAILETFVRSIGEGLPAGPDLLIAIHADLTPEGACKPARDGFLDACLQIPGGFSKVFPRSRMQSLYLEGLSRYDLTFAVGPAGTGKTYLAVAWALHELLGKTRRKLVLTRPVVEAGESLGFLPGDLVQKISPYLRPLYDSMEALIPFELLRRLEETRSIEIAPLAYMRGRNLANCIVILDEAQNTTREQMKMFLTRLGENTRAIITGDITQIDLPRKGESGLAHAVSLLSRVEGVFVCNLDARDVVRSALVRRIVEAYETGTNQ